MLIRMLRGDLAGLPESRGPAASLLGSTENPDKVDRATN